MSTTIPTRSEVDPKYTWDAYSIFSDDQAWEKEFSSIETELDQISRYKDRLGESSTVLAEAMEMREHLSNRLAVLSQYSSLFYYVEMTRAEAVNRNEKATHLGTRLAAAFSFMAPELLAVGTDKVNAFIAQEPRLAIFKRFFERLFERKAHVRSAEVEEILNQLGSIFYTSVETHNILTFADMSFKSIPASDQVAAPLEVSQGSILNLLKSPNREVRRQSWQHHADAYLEHRHTLANCLTAGIKQNVFMTKSRHFETTLQAALHPYSIPESVFHNLLDTYRKYIPLWHRYWQVKREGLGYSDFHVYDIKAPLTNKPLLLTYEGAVDEICAGMKPLGDEYVAIMRRGCLEQRWVDVYPNKGKSGGAFSAGAKGTHPFILTNHTGDVYGMSTLAHELGHSMHSYYTRATQPYVYTHYSMFVAEVASNFNQALVRDYLLKKNSDPDFQINVIEEAMGNFHRYFFIMPILSAFEHEVYQTVEKGEGLTADSLISLTTRLFKDGYGNEAQIDHERIGITWAQFPHHIYANYYMFQYATGIAAAHALAEKVLTGDPRHVANYLEFLKTGDAIDPLEALQLAGVDMRTSEAVEKTFAILSGYIDQLEMALKARK